MYRYLLVVFFFLTFSVGNTQVLFSENFEGVINNSTQLPANWQESGNSLDGMYTVGDSSLANYILNQSSLWKVPAHGMFVMTNDVRCSYEKGIGFCDKSKDRLVLPLLNIPTYSGSLILRFDAFFTGKLGSIATVEVSLNGGSSWVKEFDLTPNNDAWQKNSVNLSKYIGESNVLISFLYNDNNLVRDGLAIDNVILQKQTPWKDASIDFVGAAKYASIPIFEVDSIPLSVTFHNAGSLLLDSTEIKISVVDKMDMQHSILSYSKIIKNTAVNDTVYVELGKFLPTIKNKSYRITHVVKSKKDTVSYNDTLITDIQISESLFGRDDKNYKSVFDLTSTNSITVGNVFTMKNPAYVDSIYFETHTASIGTNVQVFIYPVVKGKVATTSIGQSDVYTLIQSSEQIVLPVKSLVNPRVLLDTGDYLFSVQKMNGGGSMGLALCDNYYLSNSVFMRIGGVAFQTLDSYFSGTKKTIPIIRAFLSPSCKLTTDLVKINTKCQFSTGALTAIPKKGKSPYTYLWNTGSADSVISKLGVGKYAVRITDYYNCIFDSSNILMEPYSKPIIKIDSLQHPLCYNSSTGYISITTNHPELITKVKWNGVTSNQLFLDKASFGKYTIDVVDGNNCEDSIKVELFNPDSLDVTYLVKDETVKSKGIISLIVNGGNPPYSFNWGDTIHTNNRIDLKGDSTYSVVISDTNGCVKTAKIYVASTVGLLTSEMNSIQIYPNPTDGVLFIKTDNLIKSVSIVDIYGKVCEMKQGDVTVNSFSSIDVSTFESGVYFLRVETEFENREIKFVKN
jgi:hypothetical protein